MGATILAFLIACLLVWVLTGNAKKQAKEARNELGRRVLLWALFWGVVIVVGLTIAMNATVTIKAPPKEQNTYYDMLEKKHDCERDTRDGSGVWIIDRCFPRVDLGNLEGKYKEEWERMGNE
ncbi:hypothetical protein OWP15_11630 [Bacillus paranthracis]|uniref:hypothetical protein n=1 Tax=Bacillus paranthracis TaxID=2026186 RepID=UPI000789EBD7|nr:hypothetical protein [Bacillus paranthracis]KYQ01876.1 hypothetical protein B4079_3158 [Bacillus cereus]MDK7473365.1 hypothetical protein [Bacillus paranthracis]